MSNILQEPNGGDVPTQDFRVSGNEALKEEAIIGIHSSLSRGDKGNGVSVSRQGKNVFPVGKNDMTRDGVFHDVSVHVENGHFAKDLMAIKVKRGHRHGGLRN